jgi:hypothetical protein
MTYVPDQRRRWFGLFYLISSGGLLVWGLTLLHPVLRGWLFVAYWFACFLCALLALVMAWLDLRAIRRQARAERRELLDQALSRISRDAQPHGHGPTGPGHRTPSPPRHDA